MWYEQAAPGGSVDAQNNLGNMYREGKGVVQDFSRAFFWFEAAARQGKAIPQLNLATVYANGEGVSRDLIKGLVWATVASLNGHPDGETLADEIWSEMSIFQRIRTRGLPERCMESDYEDC